MGVGFVHFFISVRNIQPPNELWARRGWFGGQTWNAHTLTTLATSSEAPHFWHGQMHAVSGTSLALAAAGIGLTQIGGHVEPHNGAQLAGGDGLAQAQEGGDAPVVLGHAPERGWLQALEGRGGKCN